MFITIRAASEIKGPIEKLLKDLNVVGNTTNYEILSKTQKEATEQWRKDKVTYPSGLEQKEEETTKENTNDDDNYLDFDGKNAKRTHKQGNNYVT